VAVSAVIQFYVLPNGGKLHGYQLTLSMIKPTQLGAWLNQFLFFAASAFTKLSVLAYYKRISRTVQFQRGSRVVGYSLNVLVALSLIFLLISEFWVLFECK
jgi:hypothetical protein